MPVPLEMTQAESCYWHPPRARRKITGRWVESLLFPRNVGGYLKILALRLPGKYYFPFRGKFLFPVSNVSSPKKLSSSRDASQWIFDCFILQQLDPRIILSLHSCPQLCAFARLLFFQNFSTDKFTNFILNWSVG